ncbi:MAG: hypothetical protein MR904_02320 [Clostridia bacterium]|nr:hypothetical protein [Clostridia bacterium]
MKNFKIGCYDKEKNFIGDQNVTMSDKDIDSHKVLFSIGETTDLIIIDVENQELILNNTKGDFDQISTEKPTAKLKISNIKMDYEDNLTFTIDGSSATYRLSGASIDQKKGASFTPIINFESPLNITLSSTLFEDIDQKRLQVDGLPYQMYEALTDKSIAGVSQYESTSKLLHLVKYNDQLYVGRGHKLIPVNKKNLNLYKMGDDSVLGFTIGRNNGISGKQSSGIAFKMSETELADVAKFISGDEAITYKTEEDFKTNDIDYTRVNKQSDLTKTLDINKVDTHITPEPIPPTATPEQTTPTDGNKPQGEGDGGNKDGGDKKDGDDKKDGNKKDGDKKDGDKKDGNNKDDGKGDAKPESKKDSATLNVGAIATVLSFALAMLLISGIFVSALAFAIFGVVFATAALCDTTFTINYVKKNRLSKNEKINKKILDKKRKIEKLKNKQKALVASQNTTKANKVQAQIDKISQSIEKEFSKLTALKDKTKEDQKKEHDKLDSYIEAENIVDEARKNEEKFRTEAAKQEGTTKADNDTQVETPAPNTDDTQETPSAPPKREEETNSDVDNSILNKDRASQTSSIPTPQQIKTNCEEVKYILTSSTNNPPRNDEELDKLCEELDSKISKVCKKGVDVDKVGDEEKDVFQSYITFTNYYNTRKSALANMKLFERGTEDYSRCEEQYKSTKEYLSSQLKEMFDSTQAYINDHTVHALPSPEDLQK